MHRLGRIVSRRFEPLADNRRSIRLDGYDYARAGAYFVTVCVAGRKRILGRIRNGASVLSDAGRVVLHMWERLPAHYPNVRLDEFVIMPNHMHGIVVLMAGDGRDACGSGAPGDGRGAEQAGASRSGASDDGRSAEQAGAGRSDASDDGRSGEQAGAGLRPAPTVARATIAASRDVPPPPRRHALPEIVRAFKSFSARAINADRGTPGARVWQRNYYESIVRDQQHFEAVRRYIHENPAAWGEDRFH